MELKVQEMQELKPINFNFEELKKELSLQLDKYKKITYTEETMKEAKEDRSKLNKLSKAINDRKIEIHKEFEKPYTEFEKKIKIILEMINEPLQLIDSQVKEYENKQKEQKKQEIEQYFNEKIGDYKNLINFEQIFIDRWLNTTYKMTTIQTEIDHIFAKTKSDLTVLDGQIKDEAVNKQVKDFYFSNIENASVLSLSLQEGMRIMDTTKKLEELKEKQEIPQNITNNIQNDTESSQNMTKDAENITSEQNLIQLDFRVWVTKEQMSKLKEFLITNNIKYGKVG